MMPYQYTPKDIERVWSKIEECGPVPGHQPQLGCCQDFIEAKSHKGYGGISIDGKKVRAHRVIWEIVNGPIPKGLFVLHHCDRPSCCRPDHLHLGTDTQNRRECFKRGRAITQMLPGQKHPNAKLTDKDVIEIRRRYLSEDITQTELSRQYGVWQETIGRIVRYEGWTHLP